MLTSGHIINYDSELLLSQDYILDMKVTKYEYLRVAKSRAKKTGGTWKHEQLLNRCYFYYTALPGDVRNQLPTRQYLQSVAITYSNDVQTIINTARTEGYKQLLSIYSRNMELAMSAAVITEASRYCQQNGISFKKSAFFEKLATEINLQGLKYLPKTWRNLRDKVREYTDGTAINELINTKNEGNANRATYKNNDLLNGWLLELMDTQRNYSHAYIFRKIRLLCAQYNLKECPSPRWVSDACNSSQMQFLAQQRYGAGSRFNHKFRGYTPMQSAIYAGDCWMIDGTRVNIIDHRGTYTDRNGKKVTGQKFLYIIAVRDVMSGMPLGWEYCYEENAQAVINAIAAAVRNTGYLPYEFIYDRFPGHNTAEWAWVEGIMRTKGVIMTISHDPNAKANIERWFGTLQDVFMMESDLYYGQGVRSTRRWAHRSKEYVTAMRQWAIKNGFNFDDAIRETDSFLDAYSNTPYSSYSRKFANIEQTPAQLHETSDKPHTYPVQEHEFCYLFGLRKEVSIRNYMIQTQIDGAPYYYGIDECEVAERYTGVKITNCFDYDDYSRVHLYDGAQYVGSFDEVTPAQRFGPEKDMRAVGKMNAINEKMESHRAERKRAIHNRKEAAMPAEPEEVSPEIGILTAGRIPKYNYEDAETAFQKEAWEAEPEETSIRNQY